MMLKKCVFIVCFLMMLLLVQQSVVAKEQLPLNVYQTGDSVSFEIEERTGQLLLKGAAGQVRFVPLAEGVTPSYTISPYDDVGRWTAWLQKEDGLVEIGAFQVADRVRAKDEHPPTLDHITWRFENTTRLLLSVRASDLETGVAAVQAEGFLAEAQSFTRNETTGEFELTLDLATWQKQELALTITASDFDGNKTSEARQIPVPAAFFDYQLNGKRLVTNAIVTAGDRLQIGTNRPKQVTEPFPYEWQTEPLVGRYLFPKGRLGEVFTLSNGTKLLYRENQQPFQLVTLLKNKRRVTSRQESFQKADRWTFQARLNPDYEAATKWRLTSGGQPVELERQGDQLTAEFHGRPGELLLHYQDFDGSMHSLFLVNLIEILPITPVIQPEQPPVEPEPANKPQIQQPEPHTEVVPAVREHVFSEPMNEPKKGAVEKTEPDKKTAPSSTPFPLWLPVGVAVVILIFARNKSK